MCEPKKYKGAVLKKYSKKCMPFFKNGPRLAEKVYITSAHTAVKEFKAVDKVLAIILVVCNLNGL